MAQLKKAALITYNLNRLTRLKDLGVNVMSPEELMLECIYPLSDAENLRSLHLEI